MEAFVLSLLVFTELVLAILLAIAGTVMQIIYAVISKRRKMPKALRVISIVFLSISAVSFIVLAAGMVYLTILTGLQSFQN